MAEFGGSRLTAWIAVAAATTCAALVAALMRTRTALAEERELRIRVEAFRAQDRTGRIRAERALRERIKPEQSESTNVPERMRPIGYLRSCFKTRNGTPRQPGVVASARSTLSLSPALRLDGVTAFDGLQNFSHVVLIFEFHENTNQPTAPLKAKVRPPRVNETMGLFATRTPHRPNAIGLSVVRLDAVRKGVLYFSGADLLDGTPILDVKPYCPSTDAFPEATVPNWVTPREVVDYANVTIDPEARASLVSLAPTFELYKTADEMAQFISEVVAHEIRSPYRKSLGVPHNVLLDTLRVRFMASDNEVRVISVQSAASTNAVDDHIEAEQE